MTDTLDFLPLPHVLLSGAIDVGSETRWSIRLGDGTSAVVGQLAPDLARDVSIRRRYVRDVERMIALEVHSLAPTIASGPSPDPRAPDGEAPWRVRLDPGGESLATVLERAPLPLDEVAIRFAAIADAVHTVHRRSAVLRDLRPEQIRFLASGAVVLVDVGLARVDVLSSHTASSLLLRGSSYVAPEQLMRTAVDQRSDVWSIGVMLWQALTGSLPFGDGPPLLAVHDKLATLSTVRADSPPILDELMRRCLAVDLAKRPGSVADIAWVLRGGAASWVEDATTVCQHCDARLRIGQRLCLACGRVAVRFAHADGSDAYGLELVTLNEDAQPLEWLVGFLHDASAAPVRRPEFVIGSVHMYSEEERGRRMRLPARLYNRLTSDTADILQDLAKTRGLTTRIIRPDAVKRTSLGMLATVAIAGTLSFLLAAVGAPTFAFVTPLVLGGILFIALMARVGDQITARKTPAHYRLREAPAALPASDPLVARLAKLLTDDLPGDVRDVVAALALLVQRLVDHRARLFGEQARTVEMLTAPIEPIVAMVESHVAELHRLTADLATLDEGAMVRALGASEARRDSPEERKPILEGLDRLRTLEDGRAALFHRLLEARSLLERTVNLGLAVHDPVAEHERDVAMALATLGG